MRILGIDPGLQVTGFGVIDADGPRLSYVASGTIKTAEAPRGDLPQRIRIIFEGVREVVATYEPDTASVEIVFVNVNPQSTLLLGQARGAALAALVSSNAALTVCEYTALQMKKAIVGHGHANKGAGAVDGAEAAAVAGAAGQGRRRRARAGDHARPRGAAPSPRSPRGGTLNRKGPRAVPGRSQLLSY